MAIQNTRLIPTLKLGPLPIQVSPNLPLGETPSALPADRSSDKKSEAKLSAQGTAATELGLFPKEQQPEITYTSDKSIFPKRWQRLYSPRTEAVRPELRQKAEQTLALAMAKYDPESLKTVQSVSLLGDMHFRNVRYLGTYDEIQSQLYIVADGLNDIEKTFHHEMSSLLLKKFSENLDEKAWQALNPADFSYGSGSLNAVKRGEHSLAFEIGRFQEGFLSDYNTASLENDFNMYVENLFVGEAEFWQAVDNYPKVREKVNLVIDFFQKVNPRYTESFFRENSLHK